MSLPEEENADLNSKPQVVGVSVAKLDSLRKVTGEAKFAANVYLPRMLLCLFQKSGRSLSTSSPGPCLFYPPHRPIPPVANNDQVGEFDKETILNNPRDVIQGRFQAFRVLDR